MLFRFFPIGVAIAIIGGIGSTYTQQKGKTMRIAGSIMAWVYFLAIIYSFIFHGLIWGFLALILGYVGRSFAKSK